MILFCFAEISTKLTWSSQETEFAFVKKWNNRGQGNAYGDESSYVCLLAELFF
jgi:hypothetical protein